MMKHLMFAFCLIGIAAVPALASLSNVYVAQSAAGATDGTSCANAYAAVFFNTPGNWGAGAAQIGSDTVVHVCGVWTGGAGTTYLTFQGDGSSGHVITLLFETGAALHPDYCSNSGCINLAGHSYILIDGGVTCGETSHWSTTSCNGEIINQVTGSSGATCPNGSACTTQLTASTGSSAISTSTGSPSNIEIRNLHLHLYSRLTGDTTDGGNATSGMGWGGGTLSQNVIMHNMMIDGVGKAYVLSLGSTSGTVSGYQVYNSSFTGQCWAMGVGANAPSMNIQGLLFHDNEVSNWDAWAYGNSGNACHTNGTMWFNFGTPSGGFGYIGDTTSGIYDNYLHGSLTGGYAGSSPSGMLSCQDNCDQVPVFNNIVHYINVGGVGGGGMIYFNGPGGGRQPVYNNTLISDFGGSCIVVTGSTGPAIIKNNIAQGCGTFIEIRPNCPTCATSDYNDGYNITSTWVVNNSASSGQYISLATWRGTYGQDTHASTSNPLLDANSKLQSGSAAIGLGTNLTSAGITALDSDAAGVARPSSGAWDLGAYQYAAGGAPPPGPVRGGGKFSGSGRVRP